jgi:hypothetical protein
MPAEICIRIGVDYKATRKRLFQFSNIFIVIHQIKVNKFTFLFRTQAARPKFRIIPFLVIKKQRET